jgi:hypothetical protein
MQSIRLPNSSSQIFAKRFDDAGSGVHTLSPVQSINPILNLEASIDGQVWAPISTGTSLSLTPVLIEHEVSFYSSVRFKFKINAGQFYINSRIMIKGYPL